MSALTRQELTIFGLRGLADEAESINEELDALVTRVQSVAERWQRFDDIATCGPEDPDGRLVLAAQRAQIALRALRTHLVQTPQVLGILASAVDNVGDQIVTLRAQLP